MLRGKQREEREGKGKYNQFVQEGYKGRRNNQEGEEEGEKRKREKH